MRKVYQAAAHDLSEVQTPLENKWFGLMMVFRM